MAFEVRVDCPSCLVEGTLIETWDMDLPSCRLGVPASVECRLCRFAGDGCVFGAGTGAQATLAPRRAGERFADADAFVRALDAWARDEGLASAQDLVEAYFVLPTVAEVVAALARGERVETTFDVADYLFSSGGAGGAAAAGPAMMREEEEAAPSTLRHPSPALVRGFGGPREELLAIASVAAADGEASIDDQTVLVRAASKRGLPPLGPEDIRVWRPNEIDPPPTLVDRERVLEEMFQMGWSDGQMDESELRVIRDFARAWGIDPERLREWTELYSFGDSNRVERWFRRIGFFLFPAR